MRKPWFYILLSLASSDRYGADIQEDVRALSGGDVRLWPATLYGSLEDLVERGWLEDAPDHPAPEGSAGRERFYRLTPAGRGALEAETARLEGLARAARDRLAGVPEG